MLALGLSCESTDLNSGARSSLPTVLRGSHGEDGRRDEGCLSGSGDITYLLLCPLNERKPMGTTEGLHGAQGRG